MLLFAPGFVRLLVPLRTRRLQFHLLWPALPLRHFALRERLLPLPFLLPLPLPLPLLLAPLLELLIFTLAVQRHILQAVLVPVSLRLPLPRWLLLVVVFLLR